MKIFRKLIVVTMILTHLILAESDISIRIMATANVHNETDPCG